MAENPEELIFTAVKNNDITGVIRLLEQGVDINILEQPEERTPLYYAVRYNFIEIATLLIDSGAKYYIPNKNNMNIFHVACYYGETKILKILIKKKKESDSYEEIQELMDQNTYQGVTPFYIASEQGKIDIIEILYALHKDISNNIKIKINIDTKRTIVDYSPLLIASCKGYNEIVKKLIKWGADIEAVDNLKRSPLYIATVYGRIEIVYLLLKGGAQTNTKACTETGLTPILEAAKLGHRDIFLLLLDNNSDHLLPLDNKADPNLKSENKYGYTALMMAIKFNQIHIVAILCERECTDLNIKSNIRYNDNTGGFTALILAIRCFQFREEPERGKIAELLLKYHTNLDLNIQDYSGNTALIHAIDLIDSFDPRVFKITKIIENLLDFGADPMIKNNKDQTSLFFSVMKKTKDIKNKLLNKFRIKLQWLDGEQYVFFLSEYKPFLIISGHNPGEALIKFKKKNNFKTIINKELIKAIKDKNQNQNQNQNNLEWSTNPNEYNIISLHENNTNIDSDIFKNLTLDTFLVHHTFNITVKQNIAPERTSPGGGGAAAKETPRRAPTQEVSSNKSLLLTEFNSEEGGGGGGGAAETPKRTLYESSSDGGTTAEETSEGGGGAAQPKGNAQTEKRRKEIQKEFKKYEHKIKAYNGLSPKTLREMESKVGKVKKSKKKAQSKKAQSKKAQGKKAQGKKAQGKNKTKGKNAKGKNKTKGKKKT